ncbi:hypothetical protein F5Y10DRAFT_294354 [Nemania abortiva]|nr:hypothetical protein F5Y10DRAFT_294354 [Nemania abortiva]
MKPSASITPASEPREIYNETEACIRSFENCLSVELLTEKGWAESRLADMKLWASTVGALTQPRSSLDRRLEFQPNPRYVLISLLRTLQEFVDICCVLALAQTRREEADNDPRFDKSFALPTAGTLAPTINSDSSGDPNSTIPSATIDPGPETDSTSVGSDASEGRDEDHLEGMLQKGMKNTEGVLDQLMMLGFAIRKSGTATRLRKADSSFDPGDLEAVGKFLRSLPLGARRDSPTELIEQEWQTVFPNASQCPPIAYIDQMKDLQVFREHLQVVLIRDARIRRKREKGDKDVTSNDRMQAKNDPSDLSPKQNHLILANLRRRHRFVYAKRHQQKLDRVVSTQKQPRFVSKAPVPKYHEDAAPEDSRLQAVRDRSVSAKPPSIKVTPLLESSVPTYLSETDPSAAGREILKKISLTSQVTASHVSISVARLHYPSPPPRIEGVKSFKCPCCLQTLPEMFRDELRWKKHISEDLCPYTCPFEDCSSPEALYVSRAAWREHVLAAHGASKYWECLACAGTETPSTFSTAGELVTHTTTDHKDTMSEDQILDLQSRCLKITPPNISECPLCPWPSGVTGEPDAAANLEHLASCIHEFSLRALPWAEATERSFHPPDYFNENFDRSSQAERESSPVSPDLPEEKESNAGDLAPPRPHSPIAPNLSLQYSIISYLEKSFNEEKFLPANRIEYLTREELVRKELSLEEPTQQESRKEFVDRLVSFASGPGKRIFLILIYCDCLKYLDLIFRSGFDDTGLPIGLSDTKNPSNSVVFSLDKPSYQVQKPSASLNCFDTLLIKELRAFIEAQWLFLAPIFSSDQFLYRLHPQQPLPILTPQRECSSSNITKAQVHHGHNTMPDISSKSVMAVVVTVRHPWHQDYEREVTSLQDLQKLKNEHLISPFIAYERSGYLYTLVPWANGGNLSDFWSRRHDLVDGPQPPEPTVVLWALEQMCGLADAIVTLHDKKMVHGGLSPNSILVFDDLKSTELCILKINIPQFAAAHARGHSATPSRMGALRYAAPELFSVDGAPRSGPIDIWSIGCIYLEFLIWILDGSVGLIDFRGSGNETRYWGFRDGEFRIRKAVESLIDLEMKRLENCNQENGSALQDLLCLIRQYLLVTIPENRTNAKELRTKTEKIYHGAREAFSYLYDPKVWDPKWRVTPATLTVPTRPDTPQPPPQDQVPNPPDTIQDDDSSPPIGISITKEEGNKLVESRSSISVNPNDASHSMLQDPFAERLLMKIDWSSEPKVAVPNLCEECQALDLFSPDFQFKRTISYFLQSSHRCGLCSILFQDGQLGVDDELQYHQHDSPILFRREGPYIKTHPGDLVLCVIYADPESLGEMPPQTLPGIPLLPAPFGPTQQLILREWLQICDEDHDCHQSSASRAQGPLPTRLLDIGNDASTIIRLVDDPSGITKPYIALSFLQGNSFGFKPSYDQYRLGVLFSELPATIRDAVQITRSLGIHHLWVDALCITQDDENDVAQRIEDVFSSAYCRLAPVPSRSIYDGMDPHRNSRACLRIQDSEGRIIYISQFIDHFSLNVDNSFRNRSGWDPLERALSRRTIYFTGFQVYMECGKGVRCETLGRIPWNKASFLGDSHFPTNALRYFGGSGILLYQNLYQLCSRLDFDIIQHRAKAIAPLEERLALALGTVCAYGIVERYLLATLMWFSKPDPESDTRRIDYPAGGEIPSWSWMAYRGSIEYSSQAFKEMEVNEDISSAFRHFFNTWISTKGMKQGRIELTVPARRLSARGSEWSDPVVTSGFCFDEVYKSPLDRVYSPDGLLCVPIARGKQGLVQEHRLYWIILIQRSWDIRDKEVYTRVGVGSLSEEDMDTETIPATTCRHSGLVPHPSREGITSGLGLALEARAFSLCSPGNGILLGRPY